jgi:hypothetical protein
VTGLPTSDYARAIREDKQRRGLLFLGTENGIYVSFDDGANWQSLRLDLPVTPVHGIEVKGNDLVIATHGRSFYVMDNISVLRQLTRDMSDEPVVLFRPADATRSISRGVAIDYYLKAAADKIAIEVIDPQGHSIRTFTGTAEVAKAPTGERPPADDSGDEAFRPPPPRVDVKAGMNRFIWDMRYPGARDFPGLIMWAGSTRGPIAPPGRYTVKLTAPDGITKTQEFVIARNASLTGVTDADLQAQFALAKQINDKLTVANEAVIRIRDVKEQVGDRLKKTSDAKIKTAGDALTAKLTGVEGEIYQYRNRSSQDPLNFPIRLNNKLAALQGLVEVGDNRPTDQAYAVFKDLSARLEAQLAALDTVLKTDLAAFNTLLAKRKLQPITNPARP